MEIEAKFTATDGAVLERLAELDELAGYRVAGHEIAEMSDVYLDTAGRDLQAAGLVCRRRDRGDRVVITVKRRGDGAQSGGESGAGGATAGPGSDAIHRRDEWETELPGGSSGAAGPESWPAGEVREQVLAATGRRPLAALVEVRQSRVLRTVSRDGRAIAELSLDTMTIVAGDVPLPPQYEVEAELKGEGAEADLAALAGALQRDFALAPQPLSKFERAMAALAAAPPPGGLLSADEERLLTGISRRTDAVGRRARVLLALHAGALQRDAAERADMAPRTVRYWLNRFRREGLAIFPRRLVADVHGRPARPAPAATAPAPAATPPPRVPAAPAQAAPVSPAKAKKKKDKRKRKAASAAPAAAAPAATAAGRSAGDARLRRADPRRPDRRPARAKRSAHPGIRSSDTMAEAAFKTLRFHLDRMIEHEAGHARRATIPRSSTT